MEKRTKIDLKKMFVSIVIFAIFLLGLVKLASIGLYFVNDKAPRTRELSLTESIATIDKMEHRGSLTYSADYMTGFKALDIPLEKEEQEFLFILSKDYQISYPLLLSIMETESNFEETAISSTQDYGLMQINIVNHTWLKENLGIQDILEPYSNIRSGTYILSNLFDKYPDEREVIMAYNMGEAGAKKLWDKGVFETKYSRAVLAGKMKYENLLK